VRDVVDNADSLIANISNIQNLTPEERQALETETQFLEVINDAHVYFYHPPNTVSPVASQSSAIAQSTQATTQLQGPTLQGAPLQGQPEEGSGL